LETAGEIRARAECLLHRKELQDGFAASLQAKINDLNCDLSCSHIIAV
jgi:hypothetical protein